MEYLPPVDLTPHIIAKLVLASVLGGLVGLERQRQGKAAGLRTNIFICAGSALFTILSVLVAERHGGDPTRIAAQLIAGIGFIGAGSIIRSGGAVQGVTTAATIFVMASIGMAVGAGFYWTAVFTTLTMLLALLILGWVEKWFHLKLDVRGYCVQGPDIETIMNELLEVLEQKDLTAQRMALRRAEGKPQLRFRVEATGAQHKSLVEQLRERELICSIAPPEQDRRK